MCGKSASKPPREVRERRCIGNVLLEVQEEVRGLATRDDGGRVSRHDDEVKSLTAQISFLDEEIAVLRRRLADSPRQVRLLEDWLHETEGSLNGVTAQNERLAATLREARDQIVALKEEVDRLAQPPSGFGIFLSACDDDTADVFTGGRKMRVNVSPNVELSELRPGQEVVLNEALNVVVAQSYEKARGGAGGRAPGAAAARDAPCGRLAAAGAPLGVCVRADTQGRGRGAHPGRGPGHLL